MRHSRRFFIAITISIFMVCLLGASAFAQNVESGYCYPEGVIEVPEGTEISICDEDSTVTIFDTPEEIKEGDTFVVYLQDLPIAYQANAVTRDGDDLLVSVQKADNEVYSLLEEEGEVLLTPDMYEFYPAAGVTYAQDLDDEIGDSSLKWKDGKLVFTVPLGQSSTKVTLSNLRLAHSISGGSISLGLSANWVIDSELVTSDDILEDFPVGELRIAGIGKLKFQLSMTQSASLTTHIAGTFTTGIAADQEGSSTANKGFNVTEKSITGEGSITGALKITAGIDIAFAEADLYFEIGIKTDVKTEYHFVPNTDERVECFNFRIYLYSNAGAEAKVVNIFTGGKETFSTKPLELINEDNTPLYVDVHFENGELVDHCRFGMKIPEVQYGGFTADIGSNLMNEDRERILETDIEFPCDLTIERDLTLANGNLNLNGYTLTVEGDLIQSGGTLTVSNGTLIVHGNYRMQSTYDGQYGDSNGVLNMTNAGGTVLVDGDFIIQSKAPSHRVTAGTVQLDGDIIQIDPADGTASFNSGTGCKFVLTADRAHTLSFDDAEHNSIGYLELQNDTTAVTGVTIGKLDTNGHAFVVNGDFRSTNEVDFDDFDQKVFEDIGMTALTANMVFASNAKSSGMDLNGYSLTVYGDMIMTGNVDLKYGTLTVTGTLYQQGGEMNIHGGKLLIGGSYYIAGAESIYRTEEYKLTNGYLVMTNTDDEVRIGGNFGTCSICGSSSNRFTNGVIYIGGNFCQASGSSVNFTASGNHKVVLTGTGVQSVKFDSYSSSHFNILQLTQDISQYEFTPEVCWNTLITVEDQPTVTRLHLGKVMSGAGSTVRVPVVIDSNTGFISLSLKVAYDSSILTLKGVEDTGLLPGAMHTGKMGSPYTLTWDNDTTDSNFTSTGIIAYLIFDVNQNVRKGNYTLTLTIPQDGCYDVNRKAVDISCFGGRVSVVDVILGDVNGDGSVTNMDRLYLARYLADWPGYTLEEMIFTAADVTCDGELTNKDRMILARHLADWEGYETLPYQAPKVEVEGIALSRETNESIRIGETAKIYAEISPGNASDQKLIWQSDCPGVASVDENGVVTGLSVGTAYITAAASNGVTGWMYVEVYTNSVYGTHELSGDYGTDITSRGTIIGDMVGWSGDGTDSADKAFDGDLTTAYCSATSGESNRNYCGLDFGEATNIKSVAIHDLYGWEELFPGTMLQGSDNGSDWTTIWKSDFRCNSNDWLIITDEALTANGFRYYRLCNDDDSVLLAEIRFFEHKR